MILKQGSSREELRKFAQDYTALKNEINQIFELNQQMLNAQNFSQIEVKTQLSKRISNVVENLKKINKRHNFHLFFSLLQEVDTAHLGKKIQITFLSKLIHIFTIFLKFNQNIKFQGSQIWEIIKFFYCYQQAVKKGLTQFNKDFELIQRLRDFFAGQYKNFISESITKLKEENRIISDQQAAKNWQNILKLSPKISESIYGNKDIRQLNRSINELFKSLPINTLQQIYFNNLKQLYDGYLLKVNKTKLPCCSVYFHKNQKLQLNSHKYNDYEEVRIPFNKEAENIVRKVMLSFMNTDGGIHYIGIKKEQNQLNVQGVWMNDASLIEFLTKVHQIAQQIQPNNEIPLMLAPDIPLNISKKFTYFLQLTRFVSIQINPLIDKEHGNIDYVQISHEKKNVRTCVAKIRVKATPKYDTYMTKGKSTIESYYRNNGVIEKILPSQFSKIFTERSLSYMQERSQPGNPQCPNCRHRYKVEEQ